MDSFPVNNILICGAGTMGAGIAQTMMQADITVFLFDIDNAVLLKAEKQIQKFLDKAVEKGKISRDEKEHALNRLSLCHDYRKIKPDMVIEAIIEKEEAKLALFNDLAKAFSDRTILATNTSSISVSKIAHEIPHPERVIGMHFFNPAPLMKLVEVVQTIYADPKVIETITLLVKRSGKTSVMVQDAPGFIVNRVARHFYLEAFRIAEDHVAGERAIDKLMESIGFRMGPFALTDLIGQDVNLAVTKSLYDSFHHEARFRPSRLQASKVQAGFLGRKTGKGFYDYKVTDQ